MTRELEPPLSEAELLAVEEYLLERGYVAFVDIGLRWDTYTISPAGFYFLEGGLPEPSPTGRLRDLAEKPGEEAALESAIQNELEDERLTNSSADGERDVSEPQQTEEWRYSHAWSEDDLRDVLENGTRAMKTILPYLADHPDERVKGQVLAELVYGPGARMQQLGGALGSCTKTVHKRYGRYQWPFKAIHNDE